MYPRNNYPGNFDWPTFIVIAVFAIGFLIAIALFVYCFCWKGMKPRTRDEEAGQHNDAFHNNGGLGGGVHEFRPQSNIRQYHSDATKY